jgi:hypothetical protein
MQCKCVHLFVVPNRSDVSASRACPEAAAEIAGAGALTEATDFLSAPRHSGYHPEEAPEKARPLSCACELSEAPWWQERQPDRLPPRSPHVVFLAKAQPVAV